MHITTDELQSRRGKLDKNTPLVLIQLHPGKKLPRIVTQLMYSGGEKEGANKSRIPGIQFIQQAKEVDVTTLLGALEEADYTMVDAYYQEYKNDQGHWFGSVKFFYCRTDLAELDQEAQLYLRECRVVLDTLCREALWGVKAYCNPFTEDGQLVPGKSAISLNLNWRHPFRDSEGNPIMQRPRTQDGKRQQGAQPRAPQPKFRLSIDQEIQLQAVNS